MALPFAIPIIPVLKLLALGTLKSVFLILGACFFPRWTLKLIIGGASGMILPVAKAMCASNSLDESIVTGLEQQLAEIEHHEFDRPEARAILMGLVRKTVVGMIDAIRGVPASFAKLWRNRAESLSGLSNGCRRTLSWVSTKLFATPSAKVDTVPEDKKPT